LTSALGERQNAEIAPIGLSRPGWVDRKVTVVRTYGNKSSGKSCVTIASIVSFVQSVEWVKVIYSPVAIYDAVFGQPASEPRRLYDNRDGHLPGSRCYVKVVREWPRFFRDVLKGEIYEAVLFLDEADTLSPGRAWQTELNELVSNICARASRHNIQIFMTLQRRTNVDINLRELTTEERRPPTGAGQGMFYPLTRDPSKNLAYAYRQVSPEEYTEDNQTFYYEWEYVEMPLTWGTAWTYYDRSEQPEYRARLSLSPELSEELTGFCVGKLLRDANPFTGKVSGFRNLTEREMNYFVRNAARKDDWFLTPPQLDGLTYSVHSAYQKVVSEFGADLMNGLSVLVGFCRNGHIRVFRRRSSRAQCDKSGCRLPIEFWKTFSSDRPQRNDLGVA